MAPESAELTDMDGEVGDLPPFAGGDEIIGRRILEGDDQRLPLHPDRFDE